MAHIPYGYQIVDGKAVVDEKQAKTIRKFYNAYLEGLSLTKAAENAGLKLTHSSAGRILRNMNYLGNDFYPTIIDNETFDKVEGIRIVRATQLGRNREFVEQEKPLPKLKFNIPNVQLKHTDPYEQAEYAYSQIESEVLTNG